MSKSRVSPGEVRARVTSVNVPNANGEGVYHVAIPLSEEDEEVIGKWPTFSNESWQEVSGPQRGEVIILADWREYGKGFRAQNARRATSP